MPISLYLLSEHASVLQVFIVSFAEISKLMRVLYCVWLLGSEETERDPVCLRDSGAKTIPLWNARVGKDEKLFTATTRYAIMYYYKWKE